MKQTFRKATSAVGIIALAALAVLSACDDFSLLDELSASQSSAPEATPSPSPAPLALYAQRTELERSESTMLYPSGGTAPL